MLVSAVIPAFNAEAYLGAAIESVLAQSHADVECIVVDDGSTDRTYDIARSFRDRVRVLRQSNAGVSAARNAGAAVARGEALAFLDADDVWLPAKLAEEVALMAKHPQLGVVYCGLQVVDQALRPLFSVRPPRADSALRNIILLAPPVLSTAQAALIRKTAFDQVGGFDVEMSMCADGDIACKLALLVDIAPVDACLVLYRQHPAQMHHDPRQLEKDALRLFRWVFADPKLPDDIRRLRRRAYANLHATVSLSHRRRREWRLAAHSLASAVAMAPLSTARKLSALLMEKRRQRGAAILVPSWGQPPEHQS